MTLLDHQPSTPHQTCPLRGCLDAARGYADNRGTDGTVHTLSHDVQGSGSTSRSFASARAQVYNAWREHSQTYRCRDDLQLQSAKKFPTEFGDEVDAFEPVSVPEGVEMLAWGMKKIVDGPLTGKVFEIGMDATCAYASQVVKSHKRNHTRSTFSYI